MNQVFVKESPDLANFVRQLRSLFTSLGSFPKRRYFRAVFSSIPDFAAAKENVRSSFNNFISFLTSFDADTGKDTARKIREYYIPDFSNRKNHDSLEQAFIRLLDALEKDEKIAELKSRHRPRERYTESG